MKGYIPTPATTVDLMVNRLFFSKYPTSESQILDPGCGTGAFIAGVIRWCDVRKRSIPRIVGVDSDSRHLSEVHSRFDRFPSVEIHHTDFLRARPGEFDFVIGNPPYVPITALDEDEKARLRRSFETARGRFDLYLLFFEQALNCLKPGGRLAFITPEKFMYVETAAPLRMLLARRRVEEMIFLHERTFGDLVTYPMVTVLSNRSATGKTRISLRDGRTVAVQLDADGRSWMPALHGKNVTTRGFRLEDVCLRISCGVATGADSVFVQETSKVPIALQPFAFPTIAGRELGLSNAGPNSTRSMLIPYSLDGRLLAEQKLGAMKSYLSQPQRMQQLQGRTCVRRKPWYAFHETPPLSEILRPKILCKDITARPRFWIDRSGALVPRHSVYYLVPREPGEIHKLCEYLNSEAVREWLSSHCQRAANGFLRLQSSILKKLPIPESIAMRAKPGQIREHGSRSRRNNSDARTRTFEFAG